MHIPMRMTMTHDFIERRQYERGSVQNLVAGILNADEPVIIGSISDISLGGVKYTYALRMSPNDSSIHSIDLIADNLCLTDIPCEYAWNVDMETSANKLKELRQSGIKFGELTPYQKFLLESFMDRFTSLRVQI